MKGERYGYVLEGERNLEEDRGERMEVITWVVEREGGRETCWYTGREIGDV